MGLCALCLLPLAVLRRHTPEQALLLTMAAAAVVPARLLSLAAPLLERVEALFAQAGVEADHVAILLRTVAALLRRDGWRVVNVDATLIAQAPKLSPYIQEMRGRIAGDLEIPAEQINVKATTEEHLGFTGAGEGIAAHAVCLLERDN